MSGNMGEKNIEKWELKQGATVVDRTRRIAQEVSAYRDIVNLKPNEHTQKIHNIYIHQTGADMLKVQVASETIPIDKTKIQKKRIMKRPVKVSEMDDGGLTIALDLEWDTSTWGTEDIEAGCEALISEFQGELSHSRRSQAVRMLSKLMSRHKTAINYLRLNMQPIIHKCISQKIRGGVSVACLNLVFALQCCMTNFYPEISTFNFCGTFLDMMLVEAKMAATLIQHTFRVYRERNSAKFSHVGALAQGFGTAREIMRGRISSSNARTSELKQKWNTMHEFKTRKDQNIAYGFKGPIHISEVYTSTALHVIEYLLCNAAKDHAQSNRIDVINSRGIILLVSFVSVLDGPFSVTSLNILLHLALSAEACVEIINSCALVAIHKFMKYCLKHSHVRDSKRNLEICIRIIGRVARHIAGFYRVKDGYGDVVTQWYGKDTHPTDIDYTAVYNDTMKYAQCNVLASVGKKALIKEISNIVLSSKEISLVNESILTLMLLSSSECYVPVLELLVENGAALLNRLIDLIDSTGESECLAIHALALLVQICTFSTPRSAFLTSHITRMITPLLDNQVKIHSLPFYHRCIMIYSVIARIGKCRVYEPETLLKQLHGTKDLTSMMIYDFMRTIKQTMPELTLTFSEFICLDSNTKSEMELSEYIQEIAPAYIAKFLVNGEDDGYYAKLNWDMAAATCGVVAAFAADAHTGNIILTAEAIRFCGLVLNLGHLELSQKTVSQQNCVLYLRGIQNAVLAITRLCHANKLGGNKSRLVVQGIEDSNAIIAANYFLHSFANPSNIALLTPMISELQEEIALNCGQFLTVYSSCLTAIDNQVNEEALHFLARTVGYSVCMIIHRLVPIYGQTYRMLRILDNLCQLLGNLTKVSACVADGLRVWNLFDNVCTHLPPPMCAIGEFKTENNAYKQHLRDLPPSFFHTIANMCKVSQGVSLAFSMGFLRRALDKVAVSYHLLETEDDLRAMSTLEKKGTTMLYEEKSVRSDIAACFDVISSCANYHHPKFGSSNDMIFHPNFKIVEICVYVIKSQVISRSDSTFCSAIKVLRWLSKDSVKAYTLFQTHFVLKVINLELKALETSKLPYEAVVDSVDLIFQMAMGMRGKYLREYFPKVRDTITRAVRHHLRLAPVVTETLFAMSKHHNVTENTPFAIGATTSFNEQGSDDEQSTMDKNLEDESEGGVFSEEIQELLSLSKEQKYHLHSKPGSYEACGVTNCGSLRTKGLSLGHGTPDLTKTPDVIGPSVPPINLQDTTEVSHEMELTKLSARERRLRDELKRRKEYFHFSDSQATPSNTSKTLQSTAQLSLHTKADHTLSLSHNDGEFPTTPIKKNTNQLTFPQTEHAHVNENKNGFSLNANSSFSDYSIHDKSLSKPMGDDRMSLSKSAPPLSVVTPLVMPKKGAKVTKSGIVSVSTEDLPQLLNTKPPSMPKRR